MVRNARNFVGKVEPVGRRHRRNFGDEARKQLGEHDKQHEEMNECHEGAVRYKFGIIF